VKEGDSMCGICGVIHKDPLRPVDPGVLNGMSQRMVHRGPDEEGLYMLGHVGLAIRRLSIIDVDGGQQPVLGEDQSVVVVFNGEIYNYLALRRELEQNGHRFRSRCDTEVLVHLYEEYGSRMVDHLNGMFAFAVYDQHKDRLLLARDRLGIKPLYYLDGKEWFLFGSEIKSFLAVPGFEADMDMEALHHYLTFRFVPAPMTLFKGVRKLPPGHLLEYVPHGTAAGPRPYWELSFDGAEPRLPENEHKEAVRDMIRDAVRIRLMAEVPLGVMLSGGVDSSVVVSSMKEAAQGPISTFTLVYEEEGRHNEGAFAKLTANAFQTDHHEILLRLPDFIDQFHHMIELMDEPIADPAAIAIYNLCRFSKDYVTVLLTGVGGDELFAGYRSYREAILLSRLNHLPRTAWSCIVLPLFRLLPNVTPGKNFVHRVHQPLEEVFLGSSFVYGGFSEKEKANMYTGDVAERQSKYDSHEVIRQTVQPLKRASMLQKMIYVDIKHWLGDSHLIMMDKMCMAHSIEARTPLLDHRLVELAAAMPQRLKINLFDTKIVFREAFRAEIPRTIVKRPKQGFSTPLARWLDSHGGEILETLLDKNGVMRPIFKKGEIDRLLELHRQGNGDLSANIFTLLVLNVWLNTFFKR
jgi:asparagine synthase (glutamine-hydrolysing)